jgi:hypothetical protein
MSLTSLLRRAGFGGSCEKSCQIGKVEKAVKPAEFRNVRKPFKSPPK